MRFIWWSSIELSWRQVYLFITCKKWLAQHERLNVNFFIGKQGYALCSRFFFGGNLSTSKEGDLKMGQMWISLRLTISGLKPQPHVLQKERRVGPAMIQGRLGNCTQLPTPLSHAPFIPPVGGIEVENIKSPAQGREVHSWINLLPLLYFLGVTCLIQGLNNTTKCMN